MILDDSELIERTLAGDDAAFSELVDRYATAVGALVAEIVPRRDVVEDVAQECFIKAYRALHTFRSDARFGTWLLRIARNEAISRYRSHLRQMETFQTQKPEAFDAHADERDLPDHVLEAKNLGRRLRDHIDLLPEHYRLVLVLYYYHEQTYAEIAEITEQPMNTVKSHLRRAKARLRELLLEDPASEEWSAEL